MSPLGLLPAPVLLVAQLSAAPLQQAAYRLGGCHCVLHPFQRACGPSLKLNIGATATTVICQECRPTNQQL